MDKIRGKKKILFLVPTLQGGGAEKNTINTINCLNPIFFCISLVVLGGEEDNYSRLLPDYVSVIKFNKKRVLSGLLPSLEAIKKINPDIVFSSAPHLSLPITLFNIFFLRKTINVIRVPTLPSNLLSTNWKSRIVKRLNKATYSMADRLIVQTDQMKSEVISSLGINESKVTMVRNIVHVDQVKRMAGAEMSVFSEPNVVNLVAAGTLYSVKGFDILIKAMEIVNRHNRNIRLHILGNENTEPGYKKKLEGLIAELGLDLFVSFHGFKPNPYPYLKYADLFVLSSRKEGFPNVVLESLVLGTPVVASRCIDFTGIIDEGKNGLTVPVEDPESLALGILEVIGYPKFEFVIKNFDFNTWFFNLYK